MMKNKRLKSLLLCLLTMSLMVILLSGCQLAIEDADKASEDRLAGVFVTTEYLDLFDAEAYLNDNLRVVGGDIAIDGDTSEYYERVYAKPQLDEHGMEEFVFTELDGVPFFRVETELETGSVYVRFMSDGRLSDRKMKDGGTYSEMEGTIYVAVAASASTEFYFNPVYQTSNGLYYVTTGQGFSSEGMMTEGENYSHIMEQTTTTTDNGETESFSTKVTVSIEGVLPPEKYVLIHMDENNTILSAMEYFPGAVPGEMTIPAETAYMLLETHKRNGDGELIVERSIANRGNESFTTFWVRSDGVCVKEYTYLTWN